MYQIFIAVELACPSAAERCFFTLHLYIHIVASSRFPVEFHTYAYSGAGGGKGTVFLEYRLDNLDSACLQRFVHREDGFGIFTVYRGH